jgi:putative hydrolase of the HAD superfamily
LDAVVFDLFGTLVDAPTRHERVCAAAQSAVAIGGDATAVEEYLRTTWDVRHDGTLPTVIDLATHVVRTLDGPDNAVPLVADALRALAGPRLAPAASVIIMLTQLHRMGIRLGVLSDASAEIATTWPTSPLAAVVDSAVFSCQTGAVKPDQRLYSRIIGELDVPAHQTLYVGDGGGDELAGALTAGMAAVAVHRRGPADALAFGDTTWSGPRIDTAEHVPAFLLERA